MEYISPATFITIVKDPCLVQSSGGDQEDHSKYCAFCHKYGHFAYDCPDKKKYNSREEIGFETDW